MGDDVGQCFQHTGHISKYGKHGYANDENRIIKESSFGYFYLSTIQLIVGNFTLNVSTQLGQDFKFRTFSHHHLNLAVVMREQLGEL